MASAPRADLLSLLFQALSSRFGIVCKVDNFALGRQQLYSTRRQSGDPSLDCLQFRQSPKAEDEIWIVKGPSNGEDKG